MAFFIHEGCTGCTACARQCPAAAIEGEPDLRHRIDPDRCTNCGVCGLVCPEPSVVADAVGAFTNHVPRSLRPRPVVDVESCNGCGSCVDVCPFGSLSVDGPLYRGVAVLSGPESCVSCGYCEQICIKRAVRLEAPPSTTAEVTVP